MLFDSTPQGGSWEPLGPLCKSCRRPIALDAKTEQLRFDRDTEHKLHEMNGTYHAECARPFLSIKRALDMLSRGFFG